MIGDVPAVEYRGFGDLVDEMSGPPYEVPACWLPLQPFSDGLSAASVKLESVVDRLPSA